MPPALRCPQCGTLVMPDGCCLTCARGLYLLAVAGEPPGKIDLFLSGVFSPGRRREGG